MRTSIGLAFQWDGVAASCDCLGVASLKAAGIAATMLIAAVNSCAEGALVSTSTCTRWYCDPTRRISSIE